MALSLKREKSYTVDEYLALEEAADHKSEYHDGLVYAMAGGSFNHTILTDLEEVINLQSISCEIPLSRLYEQVDWLAHH